MDLGPRSRYYSVPSMGHGENWGESQWLVIISQLRHLMCLSSWSFWVLGHSYFLDLPGPWKSLQSPGCELAQHFLLGSDLLFVSVPGGGGSGCLMVWTQPPLPESQRTLSSPPAVFPALFGLCCAFPTPRPCSSAFLPASCRNSWNCPGLILCFKAHTFPEVLNRELHY